MTLPLEKQMWGDEFGMCVDRFGVAWMVNIAMEQTAPGGQAPGTQGGTEDARGAEL